MKPEYNAPEVKETVRGISKLTEEMGEVLQLLGKLNAFPSGSHPDGGGNLHVRLSQEFDDLEAAVIFFKESNNIMCDFARVE